MTTKSKQDQAIEQASAALSENVPVGKGSHVYLIDGSGYIFRAFHALPPLTRPSDGLPVGAVHGFCQMLWKLLRETKASEAPTHMGVIFDAGRETFRNQIYPQYKAQRPEPWRAFNTRKRKGESFRVFPLSNWTEADVWAYIAEENIPVVPLYFAAPRPVVRRGGTLIMRDDARLELLPGEVVETRRVRFRTLGCYPLTGAIESDADTLDKIIAEMNASRASERQGRLIDHDGAASMEAKKQEGYF
mgnify:CR=1 FL=1